MCQTGEHAEHVIWRPVIVDNAAALEAVGRIDDVQAYAEDEDVRHLQEAPRVDLSDSLFASVTAASVPEPALPLIISVYLDGTTMDHLYVFVMLNTCLLTAVVAQLDVG
jgi:hypothetical protein